MKGNPIHTTITITLPTVVIIKQTKPIATIVNLTIKPMMRIIVFTISDERNAPKSTIEGFVSSEILFQGSMRVDKRSEIEKKL